MFAPTTDLEQLRQVFDREIPQLRKEDRPARPLPPDPATVQLSLLGEASAVASFTAEILEFGSDAIKIAIGPGAMVRVGQLCRLRLGQHAGDGIDLHGQVSWVETSSYILVFGILLLASHNG